MEILLEVQGMRCASCMRHVEQALLNVDGVSAAHVNLATNQASIVVDPHKTGVAELQRAIERAGYRAQPAVPAQSAAQRMADQEQAAARSWLRRFGVSLGLLIALGLLHGHAPWLPWGEHRVMSGLQLLLATFLQVYVGGPYLRGAWSRLRQRAANMDTLVALGTSTAYVAGVVGVVQGTQSLTFHDAAMILTFISLGKYLEARAKGRASQAIRRLLELSPPQAHVIRQETVRELPADQVAVDDVILVRPGDKIPLDACIVSGASDVDQAWLTGESTWVAKQPGDVIFAGTINGGGSLQARVLRCAGETVLAQMVELVRRAQESKANVQRVADRVVGWFVPGVLVVATAALLVWLLLGDVSTALTCTVAVLIVACPCALGLATPTAVLVGSGRGAEQGILIKNAQALEEAGRIDLVVLDKTGTVTLGQPQVVGVRPASGHDEHEVLFTASRVEQLSSHPWARAIVAAATARSMRGTPVDQLEVVPGKGIVGRGDNDVVLVGNRSLLEQFAVPMSDIGSPTTAPRNCGIPLADVAGHTVLYVARNGSWLGTITLCDVAAPQSAEAVAGLRRAGLDVLMLSGDRHATAMAVANQVGISQVIADVTPADKQRIVHQLQQQGRRVAMVGDGINDAPALAAANLGIALASGTGVAIESADIVLTHHDLRKVGEAILLARATLRTIRQNLAWAFLYNITLLPLAAGLIVPLAGPRILHALPALSAAAMALSSVSVVANSLWLRHKRL